MKYMILFVASILYLPTALGRLVYFISDYSWMGNNYQITLFMLNNLVLLGIIGYILVYGWFFLIDKIRHNI